MIEQAILSARGLGKRFSRGKRGTEVSALTDVSLDVYPSEILGLVGESGCGKSTLARILARLDDPDDGEIFYENENISAISSRKFTRHPLRGDIQMVFQDPTGSLAPRLTVFDLIADPARKLKSFENKKLHQRVHLLLDAVGLTPEVINRLPHQLSVGQKARVGIARALITQPRVLILDEPTSSLDASVQAGILKLLKRICRERGIAMLFISHDLHVIRLLCRNVVVMKDGEIIEAGQTEDVFFNPQDDYTRALLNALPRMP